MRMTTCCVLALLLSLTPTLSAVADEGAAPQRTERGWRIIEFGAGQDGILSDWVRSQLLQWLRRGPWAQQQGDER